MENEIWLPIGGFEGCYEVSSLGRVRSLFGRKYSLKSPRILQPQRLPIGYLRVSLGHNSDRYIHRLVATAFIANPNGLPCVNHFDGNRGNNKISNLEWCTQKQNLSHAVTTGLMQNQAGDGNHNSRLTTRDVMQIRVMHIEGIGVVAIAKQFNVSSSNISQIVHWKHWRHLPKV